MLTLNQILRRIKTIAEAHQQVRTYKRGLVTDFLTDQTTLYPAIFLQNNSGNISTRGSSLTLNFRMFFVDLVHVSEETKDNEVDVQSDMVSVAQDILAQLTNPNYNDWRISTDNTIQLLVEGENDMFAGLYMDFTASTQYKQNVCQIPSTKTTYQTTD